MTSPININTGASKDSLDAVRDTVLAIITAPAGDTVKIAALEVLKGAAANNSQMTISHCHFDMGDKHDNSIINVRDEDEVSDEHEDEEDGA